MSLEPNPISYFCAAHMSKFYMDNSHLEVEPLGCIFYGI